MTKLRVMGAAEIADRLGVVRQRAYQIVNRKGFPDPIAHLAMGQVWDAADVEAWIKTNRPDVAEDPET